LLQTKNPNIDEELGRRMGRTADASRVSVGDGRVSD
jgi:hypothetical protein